MSEPRTASSPRAPGTLVRRGRPIAGPMLWIVAVVIFATTAGSYYAGLGATVGILAFLALGMILVTGYAGQFSLAVGAFYGIGAYGSALLTVTYGWPGLLAIVASAAIAALVAQLLGRPLFRLRGHFLAMGTLALTEVFYLLALNLEITGAAGGLGGIAPLNLLGIDIVRTDQFFILNWLLVGMVLWGCLRLSRGREGRALKAIRGHEAAAAAAGINIASSKTRIFTASAIISSVGGSLYAHQVLYVNPAPFGIETAIDILVIAVLGGMRSPWGAIVGAIALAVLNKSIEALLPGILGQGAVGAGQNLILGLLLVTILILRPDGIAGALGALARLVRNRLPGTSALGAGTPDADEGSVADSPLGMAALRLADDATHARSEPGAAVLVLQAQGLVKRFGGVTAVDDVSLSIHAGEVLAIIGPNGAGKSTLVNLLSGNLAPTAGTVHIDGELMTGKPAFELARHGLSRTFQTPCLFDGMDVAATVAVGAHLQGQVGMLRSAVPTPGAVREERRLQGDVTAMLTRLGLIHLADRDARSLSLGHQKQIEIARALVSRPRVLLLDEPCAGLNKAEKKKLMLLLRALGAEGIAVLVIEHDMEFVMASADRVQVLNFGATLRTGTPAEVQADQAVIDAYLGVAPSDPAPSAPAGVRLTGDAASTIHEHSPTGGDK